MLNPLSTLRRFKSHWYYWYTGHRKIAVLSMAVSALLLWIVSGLINGFSLTGVLIAVLLDSAGFWLAILYLLLLRPSMPQWGGLQASVDVLLIQQWLIPLLIGVFLNRLVSFAVAKACGYSPESR